MKTKISSISCLGQKSPRKLLDQPRLIFPPF